MDTNCCHIMVDQLASHYCLVGESMYGSRAVKHLKLAAFAQPFSNSIEGNVRVYVLSDTQDALSVSMIGLSFWSSLAYFISKYTVRFHSNSYQLNCDSIFMKSCYTHTDSYLSISQIVAWWCVGEVMDHDGSHGTGRYYYIHLIYRMLCNTRWSLVLSWWTNPNRFHSKMVGTVCVWWLTA